jgi:hypothetical protein
VKWLTSRVRAHPRKMLLVVTRKNGATTNSNYSELAPTFQSLDYLSHFSHLSFHFNHSADVVC